MSGFRAARVLGRSFSVWARNLAPFTFMSLVALLPLFAFSGWAALRIHDGHRRLLVALVNLSAGSLLGVIVSGGVTYGVFQQLRGKRATLGQTVGVGLRRMFPILGLWSVTSVAILGASLLFVVPGIIIGVMCWLAVPVAVVEQPGGIFPPLRRSLELTAGHRWPIFGLLLLFALFGVFATTAVQVILPGSDSSAGWALNMAAMLFAQSLVNALFAVGCAVTYHDLRIAKDGVDTEALAAVFD